MRAATQNLLLEGVALGFRAIWMSVAPLYDRMNHIKEVFNSNDNLKPYCMVIRGYPLQGQINKFIDRYDESRVHYENY